MVAHACNLELGRQKCENQEFKANSKLEVNLSYMLPYGKKKKGLHTTGTEVCQHCPLQSLQATHLLESALVRQLLHVVSKHISHFFFTQSGKPYLGQI